MKLYGTLSSVPMLVHVNLLTLSASQSPRTVAGRLRALWQHIETKMCVKMLHACFVS